jgi:GNAT superfamily N-acetyltransferase
MGREDKSYPYGNWDIDSPLAVRCITKRVDELKQHEYARLCTLTLKGFGGDGYMQPKMNAAWQQRGVGGIGRKTYATYLKNADGHIVGWALTFPHDGRASGGGAVRVGDMATYFFVHPRMRGRGVGTRLMAAVKRRFGTVGVYPWDTVSRGFFTAMKIPRERQLSAW